MKDWIILASAMFGGGLLWAAEPSFNTDILPIFQKSCVACHSDATASSGLKLNSYDAVMKGSKRGAIVLPGKSGDSKLVKMLEGTSMPRMPLGGDPLDEKTIATIKAWIDAGAKDGEPSAEPKAEKEEPKAEPKEDAKPDGPESDEDKDEKDRPAKPIAPKVAPVAWRPDGSLVALGRLDTVEFIDPRTRQVTAKLEGHADAVRALAFSPDGNMLAAASGVPLRSGEVKIWSVDDRRAARTLVAFKDYVTSLAFSPDGRTLAAGSYDGTIKLWDAKTGAEAKTLAGDVPVFGVAFSPDGAFVASASADGALRVWDAGSGAISGNLLEARDSLYVVAWIADTLIAGGADGSLYEWKTGADGKAAFLKSKPAHPEGVFALTASKDGATVITSDPGGRMKQWDVKTLREETYSEPSDAQPAKPEWIGGIACSPSGVIAVSVAPGSVVFRELGTKASAAVAK